jgi:EAL domain-containing protein (putative c-di-GMP-specific phosphodiesterase class I)
VISGAPPDRSLAGPGGEERTGPKDHEAQRVRAVLARKAFFLVFQPIVDFVERRTVGMEALARFPVEPVRGPDAWFAAAQAAGLGLKLELAAAGAALTRLSQVPEDLFVSVNLSPEAVTSPALLRALSGRTGSRVVVEITEHAAVEDYGPLRLALAEIKALGVRFAIDDVGSGFASLRHLLRLRPDFIKLDGLVSQHAPDPAGRALVSGIVSYASEVGATVIAEGIETPEQLDALRQLGVTHGQGFLLGGPTYLPRTGRKGAGRSARSALAASTRQRAQSLNARRANAL